MQVVTTTMQETEITDAEMNQDLEQQSLPLQDHAIESTCILFTPEETDSNKVNDLTEIIESCLKDAKWNSPKYAIKCLSHLISVSLYVDLHACYWASGSKWPCLSASIAAARWMGKGPYFACQIRHNEHYLLKHCQLLPPKSFTWHGHHTLLDNESILHDVQTYLVSQTLGTVTPWTFCQHINKVILPALGINATITESTAQQWLLDSSLGMSVRKPKKGCMWTAMNVQM